MSEEYFERPDIMPDPQMQHQAQFPQQPGMTGPQMQHMGQFPQQPGMIGPQMQHMGQFPQHPEGMHQPPMQHPEQFPHEHFEGFLAPFMPGEHHFGQFAPTMFPPAFIPRRPFHHPGSIRPCVNRFAYIWFHDGRNFWAWISYISRHTIYGYRWTGHRWVYFEADVNDVEIFICIR